MKSFIAALRYLVLPWGRTSGRRIVLDGDNGEILIYDAANTLVVTLTSQSPPGLIVGGANDPQVKILSDPGTNVGRILFDANSPSAGVLCALTDVVFNEGAANEHISFQIQGPGVTGATDRLELLINSQNADGTSDANYNLRLAGGNTLHNIDKTAGHTMFRRVAIAPPVSAVSSCLLVAATAGHTAPLIQTQTGSKAMCVQTYDGRLGIFPDSSANPALIVSADAGFTGDLLDLGVNGVQQLGVNSGGVIDNYGGNTLPTWTLSISGGGAATFTTSNAQYQRIGKLVWVRAYFVVGVAGSGAANVTFDLPVVPDRTRGRQNVYGSVRDGGVAGAGPVVAIAFQGGAGANIDRIVNSAGTDVTGALLTAGSVWTFEAMIREA